MEKRFRARCNNRQGNSDRFWWKCFIWPSERTSSQTCAIQFISHMKMCTISNHHQEGFDRIEAVYFGKITYKFPEARFTSWLHSQTFQFGMCECSGRVCVFHRNNRIFFLGDSDFIRLTIAMKSFPLISFCSDSDDYTNDFEANSSLCAVTRSKMPHIIAHLQSRKDRVRNTIRMRHTNRPPLALIRPGRTFRWPEILELSFWPAETNLDEKHKRYNSDLAMFSWAPATHLQHIPVWSFDLK
jgi:hypothetical protein